MNRAQLMVDIEKIIIDIEQFIPYMKMKKDFTLRVEEPEVFSYADIVRWHSWLQSIKLGPLQHVKEFWKFQTKEKWEIGFYKDIIYHNFPEFVEIRKRFRALREAIATREKPILYKKGYRDEVEKHSKREKRAPLSENCQTDASGSVI